MRSLLFKNLGRQPVTDRPPTADDGALAELAVSLDRAARRIVQMAGPYPPFPPEIARDTDILEITRTWIFTNDQLATRSAKP